MSLVVLLGTGTNIGKTYVGCALAAGLAKRGSSVRALKPIESGGPEFTDARQLASSDGSGEFEPPLYGFEAPVSPHLAARGEGRGVSINAVAEWIRARVPSGGWCVVETAGGVFTPLAPGITNFQLARALEPAIWVLIAPDALGVLSSLTATLIAMRTLGRVPNVCVLSAPGDADASTGTNAAEIESLGIASIAASFPHASIADRLMTSRLVEAVLAVSEYGQI